jgi:uncharacterized protein
MTLHPKIKELKQRALPVTNTALSVDYKGELIEDRRVKGYLIVWGVVDSYGTVFRKGCCAKSIRDRGPQSAAKYKITMLWQHRQDEPLCVFDVLQEDDYGLYFEGSLDEIPTADRALIQLRSGTINQFSVGFDYVWDKMEFNEELDAIILNEIDLFEGSIVTMGANSETYALRSKDEVDAAKEMLHDETEDFIRSLPRAKQLEARQIFARHISLARVEPQEQRQSALQTGEPVAAGLDHSFISQHLNIV